MVLNVLSIYEPDCLSYNKPDYSSDGAYRPLADVVGGVEQGKNVQHTGSVDPSAESVDKYWPRAMGSWPSHPQRTQEVSYFKRASTSCLATSHQLHKFPDPPIFNIVSIRSSCAAISKHPRDIRRHTNTSSSHAMNTRSSRTRHINNKILLGKKRISLPKQKFNACVKISWTFTSFLGAYDVLLLLSILKINNKNNKTNKIQGN